jgi:hypothetical protein
MSNKHYIKRFLRLLRNRTPKAYPTSNPEGTNTYILKPHQKVALDIIQKNPKLSLNVLAGLGKG